MPKNNHSKKNNIKNKQSNIANTVNSSTSQKENVIDEQMTYERTISLLAIYEAEFEHRDRILYSRLFTLSYISLLIMLLPYWNAFDTELIPKKLIIYIGIVNEIITFIISIIQANRLDCISTIYRDLLGTLPYEYGRKDIETILKNRDTRIEAKHKKLKKINERTLEFRTEFFSISLTYFSPIFICFGIIILGLILLIFY